MYEDAIEITGTGHGDELSVGWPPGDLFIWDAELLARLRDAHRAGDPDELGRLWATAKPFHPEDSGR